MRLLAPGRAMRDEALGAWQYASPARRSGSGQR